MVKKFTATGTKKSTPKKIGGIRTKELGKPSVLTAVKKASAKAMAKKAGRPYPNLVNNMRAARRK
jgi:hypothetical protein